MPLEELEAQAAEAPPVRDFRAALAGPGPIQLIAEVKKASPSAEVIRADFDPIAIARTYQAHGAACLSVLTDAPYFQGHLSYLARIRASVAIPLLRKDFLIDEYQVVEARLAGADADPPDRRDPRRRRRSPRCSTGPGGSGMAALVEFHDEANLPRVLASGADLVGINNRDLRRFVTDLDLTLRLRDRIPPDVVLVSESGIRTRARRRAARGRRRLRHPRRRDPDARRRHRPGRRAAPRASPPRPTGADRSDPTTDAGRGGSSRVRLDDRPADRLGHVGPIVGGPRPAPPPRARARGRLALPTSIRFRT